MFKREITRFPKEFKKKKFQAFDWRFIIILLLSLVFHVGMVVFLKAHLPRILQAREISQIQQHYANIVLERDQIYDQVLPAETFEPKPVAEVVTSNAIVSSGPAPETMTAGAGPAGGPRATAESRLPTMGEMARGSGSGGGGGRVRARSVADVVSEIGNVGLLGMLTTGSGVVSGDYINSITDYGDIQNAELSETLAGLDAIKVSRGPDGRGWGAGAKEARSGNPAGGRVTRGSRTEAPPTRVDDLIGELASQGEIDFKKVNRVAGLANVGGTEGGAPPIPKTEEERQRLRRKPEHVMAVINRHRPALMDCYKSVLKKSPNLKGKIEVRFAIDAEGRVSWVEIVNSTLRNFDIQNCVVNRIRKWNDFGYGDPTAPDEVYRQVFTFGY